MKRTLKRELKVLEIAELEANGTSALVEIAVNGCDIWALERKLNHHQQTLLSRRIYGPTKGIL